MAKAKTGKRTPKKVPSPMELLQKEHDACRDRLAALQDQNKRLEDRNHDLHKSNGELIVEKTDLVREAAKYRKAAQKLVEVVAALVGSPSTYPMWVLAGLVPLGVLAMTFGGLGAG